MSAIEDSADLIDLVRANEDLAGFWVASTDPLAADHALTGTVRVSEVSSALVCTDGVSRLVDYFGYTWQEVLDQATCGPVRGLLHTVRKHEAPGPPLGAAKQHDDATAALCRFPESNSDYARA